jgi:hypothetical protein
MLTLSSPYSIALAVEGLVTLSPAKVLAAWGPPHRKGHSEREKTASLLGLVLAI